MLRYFIKNDEGHTVDIPKSLGDDELMGPPPPKGGIKVITAGFPWYVTFIYFDMNPLFIRSHFTARPFLR